MLRLDIEGDWFASLTPMRKAFFLASLGHSITIVGRDTYEPQTDELQKPTQLRRVNEVQHRVLACLRGVIAGTNSTEFEKSICVWVLQTPDSELQQQMEWAWFSTKELMSNVPEEQLGVGGGA